MSPKYCAPEVALHETRNTKSDIWSLGVVYLEMAVVLKGKTLDFMDEFFKQHGSQLSYVRTNSTALVELVADLMGMGRSSDNRPLRWIQDMLLVEQQLRPTAASLVASITATEKDEGGSAVFCGICCVSADDDFSDVTEEWEDDNVSGRMEMT
jgi:serine/threonine protein kinase